MWRRPERLEITGGRTGAPATTSAFGLPGQLAHMRSRSKHWSNLWMMQLLRGDLREFSNQLPTNGALCHPVDCVNDSEP
ncbi:hypothetical protein ACM43_09500 [Bradyrhizobium sp. CCBAU 45321]|nr:hypothetical protein [Bradyrhizobium sp. CCBAU 45321]